jgi:hypothetical protein
MFGIRNTMTLKSAFEDLKSTTLAAVSGLLGKLAYVASLRREQGRYQHWGMETVYGAESTERALRSAHGEIVAAVLRTPLPELVEDLQESSVNSGVNARQYVEQMRGRLDDLLPSDRKGTPSASHLNSVLVALSSLQKNRGRSTRSTS